MCNLSCWGGGAWNQWVRGVEERVIHWEEVYKEKHVVHLGVREGGEHVIHLGVHEEEACYPSQEKPSHANPSAWKLCELIWKIFKISKSPAKNVLRKSIYHNYVLLMNVIKNWTECIIFCDLDKCARIWTCCAAQRQKNYVFWICVF